MLVPSTPLSRISHLVLLDLIGSPLPIIRSFHPTTGWLFDEFQHSEERLGLAGLLWDGLKGEDYDKTKEALFAKERTFFVDRKGAANYGVNFGNGIEDDHMPFLAKGVPVVHIISVPFPTVWHTLKVSVGAVSSDCLC